MGLWQNFGVNNDYDTKREIILTAFHHGVTHFDLADNYGSEPGRAEIRSEEHTSELQSQR